MIRALIAYVVACASSAAPVVWETDETVAFTRARAERKDVLVHFVAIWSKPSMELDRRLRDAAIAPRFVALRIDVTDGEIQERYGMFGTPGLVVVRTDGTVLERMVHLPTDAELRALVER